jgi:hypothetical protein
LSMSKPLQFDARDEPAAPPRGNQFANPVPSRRERGNWLIEKRIPGKPCGLIILRAKMRD